MNLTGLVGRVEEYKDWNGNEICWWVFNPPYLLAIYATFS
jgi:hypothetical protein